MKAWKPFERIKLPGPLNPSLLTGQAQGSKTLMPPLVRTGGSE